MAPSIKNVKGKNITIYGYITVLQSDISSAGGRLMFGSNVNSDYELKIEKEGLLVIEGDLYFENNSVDIIVKEGGRLVILGSWSSTNKISIKNEGIIVIRDNMTFGGTQGVFSQEGNGSLYVGGSVSGKFKNNDNISPNTLSQLNQRQGYSENQLYKLLNLFEQGELVVRETDNVTIVNEQNMTDSFEVELSTKPESDVVVDIVNPSSDESLTDISSLTFTTENWNIPQSITMIGIDDHIIDGDQFFDVSISVNKNLSAANYQNVPIKTVKVLNIDDDLADVIISPSTGSTSENGKIENFTFRLTSKPSHEVRVKLKSNDESEGTVSPKLLIVKPEDWNKDHVFTVTGVDDEVSDRNVVYQIIIDPLKSTDSHYDSIDPDDISLVNITKNNDIPMILGHVPFESDEDKKFDLEVEKILIMDSDNTFPDDFEIKILVGNNYASLGKTVIPAANFNGDLTIQIQIFDGLDYSNIYNLEVPILPINDKPIAKTQYLESNGVLMGNLLDYVYDIDGDNINPEIFIPSPPESGELTVDTDGNYYYTADLGFEGIDSFEYEVCDSGEPSLCTIGLVNITVVTPTLSTK